MANDNSSVTHYLVVSTGELDFRDTCRKYVSYPIGIIVKEQTRIIDLLDAGWLLMGAPVQTAACVRWWFKREVSDAIKPQVPSDSSPTL